MLIVAWRLMISGVSGLSLETSYEQRMNQRDKVRCERDRDEKRSDMRKRDERQRERRKKQKAR